MDKYINNYSGVKPENIIKLKRYMHNGLSIYETMYCKNTFLSLPCLSYTLFTRPIQQNSIIMPEVATNPLLLKKQLNLQKHMKICCCSFNKVSMKRKKLHCKKILT